MCTLQCGTYTNLHQQLLDDKPWNDTVSWLCKQRWVKLSEMSDGNQWRQQVGWFHVHILLQVLPVVNTNRLTQVQICCKKSVINNTLNLTPSYTRSDILQISIYTMSQKKFTCTAQQHLDVIFGFPISPGSAEGIVRRRGKIMHLLSAYFLSIITAKIGNCNACLNYSKPCVITFWDTV